MAPDYLSTFALDVDTASYGYARRKLADGELPGAETVRPEEFVNSFRQGYRRPAGNGFSVTVDGARTDTGEETVRGPATGRSYASVWPPASRTSTANARPPRSPSWSTSPARWPNPAASTW